MDVQQKNKTFYKVKINRRVFIILDLYLVGLLNINGNAEIINKVVMFSFAYLYEKKIVKPAIDMLETEIKNVE